MKKKLPLILGIGAALLIGALVIGYFTLHSIVQKGGETLGPPAGKATVTVNRKRKARSVFIDRRIYALVASF